MRNSYTGDTSEGILPAKGWASHFQLELLGNPFAVFEGT